MNVLRLLPRFRKARRELPILEAREQWSRSEIEDFQLDRLNRLWAEAIQRVPYFRTLQQTHHLPPQFASLEEYSQSVPMLPKKVVRERSDQILSEQPRPGHWGRTGGSTGTPMKNYWEKQAHLEMLRCKYRMQAAWGIDVFDRMAFLWGHSYSFKPGLEGWIQRNWQPVADRLRNRLRLSAYNVGPLELQRYLRLLVQHGSRAMYGYSRAIYLLAQEARAAQISLKDLKLVILTGEPAFEHLVKGIEGQFQVPAVIEYGSVECGFLAGEGTDRILRVREDVVYLETLPRDDGRYDIVVSILNNPSFPLLRYVIEDVTDAPMHRPEKGFSILENVAGRSNDLIVGKQGRWLHSARFDAFFKYQVQGARRFRLHQRDNGTVHVSLELEPGAQASSPEWIEEQLQELVEGYPVQVEIVPTIPLSLAGKHRLVVSDLDVANRSPGALPVEMQAHSDGKGEH